MDEIKKEDNVVLFTGETCLDIDPNLCLRGAIEEGLESVVLIGTTKDGFSYYASSLGSNAEALFMIEKFKFYLLGLDTDE